MKEGGVWMPGFENLLFITSCRPNHRLAPFVLRDPFGGLKEVAYVS
jgi:hypothetical protein